MNLLMTMCFVPVCALLVYKSTNSESKKVRSPSISFYLEWSFHAVLVVSLTRSLYRVATLTRRIYIRTGSEIGRDWYMFDVGGVRTSVSPMPFIQLRCSLTFLRLSELHGSHFSKIATPSSSWRRSPASTRPLKKTATLIAFAIAFSCGKLSAPASCCRRSNLSCF